MDYKWIIGYEGDYDISESGEVRSHIISQHNKTGNPKPLFVGTNKWGYRFCRVGTKDKLNKKSVRIHREVAKAFVPNPENLPEVNHIDGDKSNNHYSNLEWVSREKNIQHAWANGLYPLIQGEKQNNTKLNSEQVLRIFNSSQKIVDIAKEYNMHVSAISDIKNGHTWGHVTGLNKPRNKWRRERKLQKQQS
jgi:hypothetical protein